MDFWVYLMMLGAGIIGFIFGTIFADHNWLDHAFYGETKIVDGKEYKIIELKKRIV